MSNLSNFQQRLLTGVLGSAVFITGLWYSQWTYLVITSILINFCLWEFYHLIKKAGDPQLYLGMIASNFIFYTSFGVALNLVPFHYLVIIIPLIGLIFFTELYRKKEQPFTNVAFTLLGLVYVSLPFSLLHFVTIQAATYEWIIVLGCFLLIWTSDSFAYFSGRLFGRTKLFERISPKKTWEGSAGSLVFTIGMALLINNYSSALSMHQWIAIAIITVICGGMGDLVESLLKRSLDIKDSGNILPGHGGFLDRFDGLLLAIPFILTYLILTA